MARTVKQQVLDIISAAGNDGATANEIGPQVKRPADSVRRIVGTLRAEGHKITLTGNGYVVNVPSVPDSTGDSGDAFDTDIDAGDEETEDFVDGFDA